MGLRFGNPAQPQLAAGAEGVPQVEQANPGPQQNGHLYRCSQSAVAPSNYTLSVSAPSYSIVGTPGSPLAVQVNPGPSQLVARPTSPRDARSGKGTRHRAD
jgi:hypothetical protein